MAVKADDLVSMPDHGRYMASEFRKISEALKQMGKGMLAASDKFEEMANMLEKEAK